MQGRFPLRGEDSEWCEHQEHLEHSSSGQQLRPVQTPPHCLQEGRGTQTPALPGQEPPLPPCHAPHHTHLLTQLAFLWRTFLSLSFMCPLLFLGTGWGFSVLKRTRQLPPTHSHKGRGIQVSSSSNPAHTTTPSHPTQRGHDSQWSRARVLICADAQPSHVKEKNRCQKWFLCCRDWSCGEAVPSLGHGPSK